ncbi:MAG: hypothetical protein ACLTW9_00675 [Enterocloster sp.]
MKRQMGISCGSNGRSMARKPVGKKVEENGRQWFDLGADGSSD